MIKKKKRRRERPKRNEEEKKKEEEKERIHMPPFSSLRLSLSCRLFRAQVFAFLSLLFRSTCSAHTRRHDDLQQTYGTLGVWGDGSAPGLLSWYPKSALSARAYSFGLSYDTSVPTFFLSFVLLSTRYLYCSS